MKTRIVESLTAAASVLKIGVETVKKAKSLGCPAFKPGNRIDTGELKKWIAENAGAMSTQALSLTDQKLNEEIRKLRIANDVKEGKLVAKASGLKVIEQISAVIHVLLETKLESEYPSVVAGLEVQAARVYGRRLGDSIRMEIHKMATLWGTL